MYLLVDWNPLPLACEATAHFVLELLHTTCNFTINLQDILYRSAAIYM